MIQRTLNAIILLTVILTTSCIATDGVMLDGKTLMPVCLNIVWTNNYCFTMQKLTDPRYRIIFIDHSQYTLWSL